MLHRQTRLCLHGRVEMKGRCQPHAPSVHHFGLGSAKANLAQDFRRGAAHLIDRSISVGPRQKGVGVYAHEGSEGDLDSCCTHKSP